MFNSIRAYGRSFAVAAGAALLAAVATPQLKASDLDKKIKMTFSAPVEIPGKVLPPGTYVFETDPFSANTILVMNAQENKLIGTTLTVPTYEGDAPPQFGAGGGDALPATRMKFEKERPAGAPEAVRSWNYPGDPTGFKFVYRQ